MSNLADEISKELERQGISRENLTRADLEKIYLNLGKENFPDNKRIEFIANLGDSDEVAYHYELICKQWREDKRLNLESSFDKHGGDGIEFLLEQLTKTADQNLKFQLSILRRRPFLDPSIEIFTHRFATALSRRSSLL